VTVTAGNLAPFDVRNGLTQCIVTSYVAWDLGSSPSLAVWECSTPLHRKGAPMSFADVTFKCARDPLDPSHLPAWLKHFDVAEAS